MNASTGEGEKKVPTGREPWTASDEKGAGGMDAAPPPRGRPQWSGEKGPDSREDVKPRLQGRPAAGLRGRCRECRRGTPRRPRPHRIAPQPAP